MKDLNKLVYADNAATTKVSESVLNAMLPYFSENYGNASSLYPHGQNSKKAINAARVPIAQLINADPAEIFFTGSGTESDNMVIRGVLNSAAAKNKGRNHVITTKIEHPAILRTCEAMAKQGFEITYLNVDSNGVISLEELENAITEKTALISIMAANNEIGSIQPLKEIGEIAKKHNVLFHTDAVQALGHMHRAARRKREFISRNFEFLRRSPRNLVSSKRFGVFGIGRLVRAVVRFVDRGVLRLLHP